LAARQILALVVGVRVPARQLGLFAVPFAYLPGNRPEGDADGPDLRRALASGLDLFEQPRLALVLGAGSASTSYASRRRIGRMRALPAVVASFGALRRARDHGLLNGGRQQRSDRVHLLVQILGKPPCCAVHVENIIEQAQECRLAPSLDRLSV
jgi:hypothetical protein